MLFDPGPHPQPPKDRKIGVDARRTIKRRALLARGIHPTTRAPLLSTDWGFTCADCKHCVPNRSARVYWKCRYVGITSGPATDVRKSWPACAHFRIEAA